MSNKVIEVQNVKVNVFNLEDKDYICIYTIEKVVCCQQGTLVNYDNKTFLPEILL